MTTESTRVRKHAEVRTHTLPPGPRGDPETPLPATNPRAENTSARQFTLACPRKQKSQEPSVETAQMAVIGEGRTRNPWQLEEREEEALDSEGRDRGDSTRRRSQVSGQGAGPGARGHHEL